MIKQLVRRVIRSSEARRESDSARMELDAACEPRFARVMDEIDKLEGVMRTQRIIAQAVTMPPTYPDTKVLNMKRRRSDF